MESVNKGVEIYECGDDFFDCQFYGDARLAFIDFCAALELDAQARDFIGTGIIFIFTGISHLAAPDAFMKSMPPFIPEQFLMILGLADGRRK